MEALRAAVTALVTGFAALADTFSGFRSVMTERLHEYSGAVLQVSRDTVAELKEHRKVHAGASESSAGNVAEVSDQLQRLAAGMEHLAGIRSDDERWAEVMGRLLDDVDAERQAGERERSAAESMAERLQGLEHVVQGVVADLAEMAAGNQRLAEEVGEVTATQQRVGAELAEITKTQQRVTEVLAEMAAGQQRVADDVAEVAATQQRVAEDVAEVAAVARQAAPDLEAVPLRLDDAQIRMLAEVVREAAAEKRPPPPVPLRGRRQAPLRAERKSASPRPSR